MDEITETEWDRVLALLQQGLVALESRSREGGTSLPADRRPVLGGSGRQPSKGVVTHAALDR